jgi:hypothetical protein
LSSFNIRHLPNLNKELTQLLSKIYVTKSVITQNGYYKPNDKELKTLHDYYKENVNTIVEYLFLSNEDKYKPNLKVFYKEPLKKLYVIEYQTILNMLKNNITISINDKGIPSLVYKNIVITQLS